MVENKICSHVDEKFAKTQIVQANDLDTLGKSNPFRFWQDRDRRTKKDTFNFVPRNFYTNYKTSLMRDAHDIAANIASQSTMFPEESHVCHEKMCDCANLCKNRQKREKLNKFMLRTTWKKESRKCNIN